MFAKVHVFVHFSLLISLLVAPAIGQEARGLYIQPGTPTPAAARVALVIGNSRYPAPLKNALNDARDMEAILLRVGFQVLRRDEQRKKDLEQSIREFGDKLKHGGGVGLFYYAGHAVQVDGQNYLVPVDAPVEREDELPYHTVNVDLVLRKMQFASAQTNIVILDACRDNPFARFRSLSRGLAVMNAPPGTFISYATAPGSVASDGVGGSNGLYTSHLLRVLPTPGLSIEEVFKNVRKLVFQTSAGRQVPWDASSLQGDFYFVPVGLCEAGTHRVGGQCVANLLTDCPSGYSFKPGRGCVPLLFEAPSASEQRKVLFADLRRALASSTEGSAVLARIQRESESEMDRLATQGQRLQQQQIDLSKMEAVLKPEIIQRKRWELEDEVRSWQLAWSQVVRLRWERERRETQDLMDRAKRTMAEICARERCAGCIRGEYLLWPQLSGHDITDQITRALNLRTMPGTPPPPAPAHPWLLLSFGERLPGRFGVINSAVLNKVPAVRDSLAKIESAYTGQRRQLFGFLAAWDKLATDLQKQEVVLKPAVFASRQQKVEEGRESMRVSLSALAEMETDAEQRLLYLNRERLAPSLRAIVTAKKLDWVIGHEAQVPGAVDITQLVADGFPGARDK